MATAQVDTMTAYNVANPSATLPEVYTILIGGTNAEGETTYALQEEVTDLAASTTATIEITALENASVAEFSIIPTALSGIGYHQICTMNPNHYDGYEAGCVEEMWVSGGTVTITSSWSGTAMPIMTVTKTNDLAAATATEPSATSAGSLPGTVTNTSSSSSSPSPKVIAEIVAGTVGGLLLIGLLAVFIIRRRNIRRREFKKRKSIVSMGRLRGGKNATPWESSVPVDGKTSYMMEDRTGFPAEKKESA